MISRREFFDWIVGGLCVAIYGKAPAQEQPQPRGQSVQNPGMLVVPGPSRNVADAAAAMTPGDKDSIRAVVEANFGPPLVLGVRRFQTPEEIMAAVVMQRLIDAQVAYFNGKNLGVTDEAVVDALNALASAFETPEYGRLSLLQVEFVRSRLADNIAPALFKEQVNPDIEVPMSPLGAIYVMAVLIQQKIDNAAYQVPPAEWDRDVYPRAIEQDRAMKELRRRIASGEVQVKAQLVGGRAVSDGALRSQLQRRIEAMSVMDGLKLFNETFARLGIQ
jgi:hypothetical protein